LNLANDHRSVLLAGSDQSCATSLDVAPALDSLFVKDPAPASMAAAASFGSQSHDNLSYLSSSELAFNVRSNISGVKP
jgi:hypothetical protein